MTTPSQQPDDMTVFPVTADAAGRAGEAPPLPAIAKDVPAAALISTVDNTQTAAPDPATASVTRTYGWPDGVPFGTLTGPPDIIDAEAATRGLVFLHDGQANG